MRGAAAQPLNRTGVVASAARKMENGIFFLPAARSKKKKKRAPTPMEQRLRKPKPCVTLAPNRVQPNRANNVNVKALRQTTFHKAIGNWQYAGRLSLHVPIVAVVSASEICCPERLPAGDLAILTGAAANEAPTPSPEARSGRRRLVSGTAQCPALAAIADCYSRAHQSGTRAREAALDLGACPALTRPPPCTVSRIEPTIKLCLLRFAVLPVRMRALRYGQERRRRK